MAGSYRMGKCSSRASPPSIWNEGARECPNTLKVCGISVWGHQQIPLQGGVLAMSAIVCHQCSGWIYNNVKDKICPFNLTLFEKDTLDCYVRTHHSSNEGWESPSIVIQFLIPSKEGSENTCGLPVIHLPVRVLLCTPVPQCAVVGLCDRQNIT